MGIFNPRALDFAFRASEFPIATSLIRSKLLLTLYISVFVFSFFIKIRRETSTLLGMFNTGLVNLG